MIKDRKKNSNSILFVSIVFFLVALFPLRVVAQQQSYSFINYGQSRLCYSKDSSKFMNFFEKIDDLKRGKRDKIIVAHFGGSHLQAGFWPEVLMNGFQNSGNFEGGGLFIFPFKIVKTNSPHYYNSFTNGNWKRCRNAISKEMCNNLGMCGMAAITNDSLNTFGFRLLNTTRYKTFNSVKVYHNFNLSFELGLNHESYLKFERKDNAEKGYTEFIFESFLDSLNFVVVRKDTLVKDFMLRGFSVENSNPGFYYANMGVNGASSGSFLRCSEFINELKSIPPDLVIFSLGVNDTHDPNFTKQGFMAKYDSLITHVKKASPNCAILLTTVTDNYIRRKTSNKRPIKAQEAMFELMEKYNLAVYDLYSVMGGYKSISQWYKVGMASKDKVHFNKKGYVLLADLMFEAIDKSYKYNTIYKAK